MLKDNHARYQMIYCDLFPFWNNITTILHAWLMKETLAKTEAIFGAENKDLYLSFKSMINRNRQ